METFERGRVRCSRDKGGGGERRKKKKKKRKNEETFGAKKKKGGKRKSLSGLHDPESTSSRCIRKDISSFRAFFL